MNNVVLDKWLNRLIAHQPKTILVILTVGMLTALTAQSLNMYHTTSDIADESPRLPDDKTTTKLPPTANVKFLFGEAEESELPVESIPKTSLHLMLRGALAGDGTIESSAIIQGSDGKNHFYRIGNTLPGGAILDQIYPQYVVIRYQGLLQTLAFPVLAGNNEIDSSTYSKTSDLPTETPNLDAQYQDNPEALEDRMEQLRQRLQQAQEDQLN